MRRARIFICLISLSIANVVNAQTPAISLRGFADVGLRSFTAADSFKAVLGTSTGPLFGGGVEIAGRQGIFGSVRASRFTRTGERVFVFRDEVFGLGVPETITITPLELTVGYRFGQGRRVVPYGGGGVGWHRFSETSAFSEAAEEAHEQFVGYHVLGGVEIALSRWMAAAFEGQWAAVPNALGQDPNGVANAFGESDLGGAAVRVKLVFGR